MHRHERLIVGVLLSALASLASAAGAIPPEPDAALRRLLGEYGAADSLFVVYESAGQLMADGRGWSQAHLHRVAGSTFTIPGTGGETPPIPLRFITSIRGGIRGLDLGATYLPRIDVGRQVVEKIRQGARADAAALRAAALRAAPPAEGNPQRAADLTDLARVDPTIRFDIRYATSNNFMGFALYEHPGAYLQRPAARALGRVARSLRPEGFGLLVFDAYRPWFVTKMFWDATPDSAHVFVADPAAGSRHNRGCAVDLTLYNLKNGRAVEMTGRYDEMTMRSYADYIGGTSRERWLRDLLRRAMEAQGFAVYHEEWWHFDYQDSADYGIGNMPFDRLQAGRRGPLGQRPAGPAR